VISYPWPATALQRCCGRRSGSQPAADLRICGTSCGSAPLTRRTSGRRPR